MTEKRGDLQRVEKALSLYRIAVKNGDNKKPKLVNNFGFFSGSSTWARTRDPLINSQVLLPTELSRIRD